MQTTGRGGGGTPDIRQRLSTDYEIDQLETLLVALFLRMIVQF